MSVSDPLSNGDGSTPSPIVILSTSPPDHDPPPPYPSQERRTRAQRSGRRRRTLDLNQEETQNASHVLSIAAGGGSEYEAFSGSMQHSPYSEDHNADASETTPLLAPSPRSTPRLPLGQVTRQRTLSLTSTVRSTNSIAPSLAQTVLSAFNPEQDDDLDPHCGGEPRDDDGESDGEGPLDSPPLRHHGNLDVQQRAFVAELSSRGFARQRSTPWHIKLRKYFRPMGKLAYYSSLFHLLVLNFPYALLAWVYLFVFTVAGTTTLMALPLGAVLCFLDLIGARIITRGELVLQVTFHGPLAYPISNPPLPIFVRRRPPTAAEIEDGLDYVVETSFYRNAYAMFTDPTSYQALFYFLVIKPGITIIFGLLLLILVPISFVLVWPAPATLRLARRLGIWQANIAVEGLCLTVR
ncbi:hypothetical protein WOLCODRAFT_126472 [Wolfiporia cocos MD-104 SS10]|uniref:Uncharacterized protein n=1 Tax=Wolfiporia cocos (strain MD-104) TaxID=742152 RepID=A0A2H3J2P1_WOLCO|nr:hypothetical protein WOLCODRAFT_126472 [Wolfiporia cocos MD-104 SS10]